MKKRDLKIIFASFIMASAVLAGCGSDNESASKPDEKKQEETVNKDAASDKEEADLEYGDVYKEAVAELEKAKEGKEVDFDKVTKLYTENLQSLVQNRDQEFEDKVDQHITTALQAGKDGSMDKVVVKQIFDKLMQKVFYTTMKHEFIEVAENWDNKEAVKEEIEEAKEFYAIIEGTVQKRDDAYGTNMKDAIAGGFEEMEKAVEADDQLAFKLGQQVVDKTLMKTFYLATAAVPNGYATKAANEAKEDAEAAKVEQAEGWAFYQSIASYLVKNAPEEAEKIEKQFNLETDVKTIDPKAVNNAAVRGFAKIALHELEESEENWGQDKGVITALEGALFTDMIGEDIKRLIGEEEYAALSENAQKYYEAAKAQDKENGDALRKEVETALQSVIDSAK
ncbi:hypothetical protein [Mesobacillus thioparans]|uniref:hypothetical protein n=1 Tax=Mesobacillus thioparans TaxID=370439 RepID=UPI0039EFDDF9